MIELRNVTKKHENGFTSLEAVNLQISDGEFVFIVGGSGAGKTTLAGLLIAEQKPTEGTISVDELEISALKKGKIPFYRRKLGIVFRDFRLFSDKTVYENVAFALRVVGEPSASIRTKVNAALRMVELSNKGRCYIDQLSGLEQQKVALARALANGASIIVADEPCGNVDPVQSRELIELFCRIQSRYQKTVILFTHDIELARSFGKRTVYLQRGKIVDDVAADCTDDEILAEAQKSEKAEVAPMTEETAVSEALEEEITETFAEESAEATEAEAVLSDEDKAMNAPSADEFTEETSSPEIEPVPEETEEVSEETVDEPIAEPAPAVEEAVEEAVEIPEESSATEVVATFASVRTNEASEESKEPENTASADATMVLQMPTWTAEKAADGDTMEVRSANISTDALESVLAELFGNMSIEDVFGSSDKTANDASISAAEEEKK